MEVGRECAVVRMPRGGGGGLSIGVANAAGSGTLADPGIGSRARRFQREFLRGDGGGVQQTRHRPVELLQQHLEEEERFNGTQRPKRRRSSLPHLCRRHVLEGHVSVGQFTGCDSKAVNIRPGIITLEVLREETFEISSKRHS